MQVSSFDQTRLTGSFWVPGMFLVQCLGWKISGERYWCLSVGLQYISVLKSCESFITSDTSYETEPMRRIDYKLKLPITNRLSKRRNRLILLFKILNKRIKERNVPPLILAKKNKKERKEKQLKLEQGNRNISFGYDFSINKKCARVYMELPHSLKAPKKKQQKPQKTQQKHKNKTKQQANKWKDKIK